MTSRRYNWQALGMGWIWAMMSRRVGLYKCTHGGGPHRTSGSSPRGGRWVYDRHTEERPELCSGSVWSHGSCVWPEPAPLLQKPQPLLEEHRRTSLESCAGFCFSTLLCPQKQILDSIPHSRGQVSVSLARRMPCLSLLETRMGTEELLRDAQANTNSVSYTHTHTHTHTHIHTRL